MFLGPVKSEVSPGSGSQLWVAHLWWGHRAGLWFLFLSFCFLECVLFSLPTHWTKTWTLIAHSHPSFGSSCQLFIETWCASMAVLGLPRRLLNEVNRKPRAREELVPWQRCAAMSAVRSLSLVWLWTNLADLLFCFAFSWLTLFWKSF